jgi:L-fuconolactonase
MVECDSTSGIVDTNQNGSTSDDHRGTVQAMQHLNAPWLASGQELEPHRQSLDPYHRFSHRCRYKLGELLRDTSSDRAIGATVFVQCDRKYPSADDEPTRPLNKIKALVRLAKNAETGANTKISDWIVGFADLSLVDPAKEVRDAPINAANGQLPGIRVVDARHGPFQNGLLPRLSGGIYVDDRFRAEMRRLDHLNQAFDAWEYHTQLRDVIDVAQFVSTAIVLNHIGGLIGVCPYDKRKRAVFKKLFRLPTPFVACSNVFVKIGGYGIAMFGYDCVNCPVTLSSMRFPSLVRPTVEAILEAFGTHPCMFESKLPVDRASGSCNCLGRVQRPAAAASVRTNRICLQLCRTDLTQRRCHRLTSRLTAIDHRTKHHILV